MKPKQIEATILGQSYVLACPPDGEQRLLQAVATVDREMSLIRDAGKVKARERMAVLAALNLAYQRTGASGSAAALAPVPSAAPVSTQAIGAAPGPAAAVDEADRVGQLIRRIDAVLGEDGRLF